MGSPRENQAHQRVTLGKSGGMSDLVTVLAGLRASQIACSISSYCGQGYAVKVGLASHKDMAERLFTSEAEFHEIADWLVEEACTLFPQSAFARAWSGQS